MSGRRAVSSIAAVPPEQTAPRTRPDLCPGVLALHQAADGGLARIRLPGGVLTAAQLRLLAQLATDLGDGAMELTSRANLQLRGLGPDAAPILSQALYDAGLLPSITHERVRNIIASPLSGLDPLSTYDVLPVAAELDRLLCADPALAELPGRFLFTLDDGRGDLGTIHSDLGVRAVDKTTAELLLAGTETGVRIPWADVPAVLVAAADAFLAERTARASTAWRLAELPDGVDAILASIPLTGVHSSHRRRWPASAREATAGAAIAAQFPEHGQAGCSVADAPDLPGVHAGPVASGGAADWSAQRVLRA